MIEPRDVLEAAGCTCYRDGRDGCLVDWRLAVQYHTYTDCPLRVPSKTSASNRKDPL